MLTEITSPVLGEDRLGEHDHDLTRQHGGEPQGQRNIVHGQVRDSDDRPVPYSLVEVRQANAAGRYRHVGDDCPAPLGPDFTWVGRTLTDDRGPTGSSRSAPASTPGRITVTPGGRPTSTSSCSAGPSLSASSPRCTFPTIRCSSRTPCGTRSPLPRHAPACPPPFDYDTTEPEWALACRWDIVLRGREQTPSSPRTRSWKVTSEQPHRPGPDGRALPGHRPALAGRSLCGRRRHRRGRVDPRHRHGRCRRAGRRRL